MVNCYTKFRK